MSTQLDCTTEKGKAAIRQEVMIVHRICEHFGFNHAVTRPDSSSPIDLLLMRGSVIVGAAEVKARTMSLTDLKRFGSYLITARKLDEGREIASLFCVPFYLIVGLFGDEKPTIVYWRLTSRDGSWLFEFRREKTRTQATVNGGVANRTNAYLPLGMMQVLP